MLKAYRAKKNTFEALNAYLQVDFPLDCYLNWYRCHRPNITLAPEVVSVLQQLQEKGYTLGLITDGRSRQQRHKIEALGLYRFIEPAHIIISEEFGHEKPCRANYRYFMELYPHAERYVYVGDNPHKDFVAPKELGWLTCCLLDHGDNIHEQSFELPNAFLPQVTLQRLSDLLSIVS